MWGRLCGPRSVRLGAGALVLSSLLGCATQRAAPMATVSPARGPMAERDATGAYRFNMTQHGRRMSAEEFDAWMKARGIRVAKGAPANAGKPVAATPRLVQAGKAKPRTAKATAAARTPPAPAGVRLATGSATPAIATDAKKTATRKPNPATPVKSVETASLQVDPPKAKTIKRGEG